MKVIEWILRIAIFVLLIAFALGNTQPATVGIFGRPDLTLTAPIVVFLLLFFALGLVLGVLVHAPRRFSQKREIARLNREIERLDQERRSAVAAGLGASPIERPVVTPVAPVGPAPLRIAAR